MAKLHVDEVVIGIIYLLLAPHALFWGLMHAYKFYQDVYTKERLSVSHRRSAPQRTKVYKYMAWLTCLAVVGWSLNIFFGAIALNFTKCGAGDTIPTLGLQVSSQTAKPAMYLTYILRLHQCYALSAFGYGRKKLICFATFIIIFEAILFFAQIIGMFLGQHLYKDIDGEFPYACYRGVHEDYAVMIGGLMILTDVILSIIAIVAFIIPISRLFKNMRQQGPEALNDKKYKKMIYAGYKYKVCVICASVSTLLWIFLLFSGVRPILVSIAAGIDSTINMFCLMFMTPYYPDYKYYQRLCYCCICCCDCKKQSYQSKASDENRNDENHDKNLEPSSTNATQLTTSSGVASSTGQTKSVDTMDAVQVVAGQTGNQLLSSSNVQSDTADNDNNNDNEEP